MQWQAWMQKQQQQEYRRLPNITCMNQTVVQRWSAATTAQKPSQAQANNRCCCCCSEPAWLQVCSQCKPALSSHTHT
jgi:hypothetical protein